MLMMLAVAWILGSCGPADAPDAGCGSGSGLPAVQLMLMMPGRCSGSGLPAVQLMLMMLAVVRGLN